MATNCLTDEAMFEDGRQKCKAIQVIALEIHYNL